MIRAPEIVGVFGIEAGDDGVAGYDVQQGKEPGVVNKAVFRWHDGAGHSVFLRRSRRLPQQGEVGLLRRANGAIQVPDGSDLVDIGGVLRAGQGGRRAGPELRRAAHRERNEHGHLREHRGQRAVGIRGCRRRTPHSGGAATQVARKRRGETVCASPGQNFVGDVLAPGATSCDGNAVATVAGNLRQ